MSKFRLRFLQRVLRALTLEYFAAQFDIGTSQFGGALLDFRFQLVMRRS